MVLHMLFGVFNETFLGVSRVRKTINFKYKCFLYAKDVRLYKYMFTILSLCDQFAKTVKFNACVVT